MEDKKWPRVGDRLVHRFREERGEVMAEVIATDHKTGRIALQIGKRQYESLSAAAQAYLDTCPMAGSTGASRSRKAYSSRN